MEMHSPLHNRSNEQGTTASTSSLICQVSVQVYPFHLLQVLQKAYNFPLDTPTSFEQNHHLCIIHLSSYSLEYLQALSTFHSLYLLYTEIQLLYLKVHQNLSLHLKIYSNSNMLYMHNNHLDTAK